MKDYSFVIVYTYHGYNTTCDQQIRCINTAYVENNMIFWYYGKKTPPQGDWHSCTPLSEIESIEFNDRKYIVNGYHSKDLDVFLHNISIDCALRNLDEV